MNAYLPKTDKLSLQQKYLFYELQQWRNNLKINIVHVL